MSDVQPDIEENLLAKRLPPINQTIEETIPLGFKSDIIYRRKGIGITTAIVAKGARSFIQYAQHRSGNSHFNKELNNYMRVGSNAAAIGGAAIFYGGPAAGIIAGGIVVNELVNIGVDVLNYNYDRKLDTMMVHNMAEVSGNLSYGRRGGSR
jgi:hypothetical protein